MLDWEIFLLFHTIQLAKSLPFYKPEALKTSTRFKFCLTVLYWAPLFSTVVTMPKKKVANEIILLGIFC